jgi:hypothetical protein
MGLCLVFSIDQKELLTCRKISWHGAYSFTSPPKEGMLQIFSTLKNPSPSARFESTKIGSNSKDANHHTTEDDFCSTNSGMRSERPLEFWKSYLTPDLACKRILNLTLHNLHGIYTINSFKRNYLVSFFSILKYICSIHTKTSTNLRIGILFFYSFIKKSGQSGKCW